MDDKPSRFIGKSLFDLRTVSYSQSPVTDSQHHIPFIKLVLFPHSTIWVLIKKATFRTEVVITFHFKLYTFLT